MDGYPIYGAYAYTDTNGTGPIKRMKSGYTIANPNATTRVNGPNVSTTYPLGCFMEDYAFTNAGDLDLRNGRNCRTPEYPNGTYAYFVTIDGNMNPAFPYTMYKNYYGIVQAGNTGPNGAHNTIPGTAVTYATLFAPTISIATNSTTVCAGTSVTFTATATKPGNSPVYQWKKNNVNAGTGISYTSNTLANGDVISCTITSNAYYLTSNTATSNSITMTVNANVTPSVSITPSSQTICAGTNVNFTATPNNGGALPVYQWKKNGNVVGTNSSLYSDNALVNTDVILCELTSNAACASQSTATSNSITMTVNANVTPSVSITSSSQTICTGTNVNFTATPNNGGALPVYQWKKNGNVVGTNSSAYSDNALANSDVVLCELTSNAACASPSNATSNSIAMTVSATVPPKSGAISGTRYNLCAAVGNFTYSVAAVSTATSYLWVAPANSTIISGQGTPSVVITFASNFKAGTLSVTPSNGCGNGTVRTATLYSIPEKPATMLGSSTVCANQQNVAYSCATSTGATSYKWTVPTGSTIASGQGTNNILVNFGTIAGTIDVVAKNACGGSSKNSLAFNITCRTGSDLIGALQNDFVVVNPFNDKIILHAEEDINNVTATLYDVTGREILNWNNLSFSANEQMELSVKKNIQLGIYFLSIKNSNANFVVKLNHL